MQRFAALFEALDTTNSTNAKVDALVDYFASAPARDAAWALYFLSGRKLLRILPAAQLRAAAMQTAQIPVWLFEEAYATVGDLAETIACLIPAGVHTKPSVALHEWVEKRIFTLREQDRVEQLTTVTSWWGELGTREIFLLNKLLTGSFRTGVSHTLVVRALAKHAGQTEAVIAHRLMGNWKATETFFTEVVGAGSATKDPGLPYPFFLASPLDEAPKELGSLAEWLPEWKWDGIRAQAIRRSGGVFLWSRGEELITERFPELAAEAARLPPGTVLDGEILAYRNGKVMPFADLQKRIGRKKLSPKILEEIPVAFMVFDLLEEDGQDLREISLAERRARLEKIFADCRPAHWLISPRVEASSWEELGKQRMTAREKFVEGIMLKRLISTYRGGRKRGDWWKWKVQPYTVDAVLLYAQAGHGRRATLYTDYTFGVWKGTELVPVAKAYSGLTDAEILDLDRWIRRNTVEKFGPVRSVKPEHVFEIAFEGIAPSSRHKAGVAVRFPRILRRREDKTPSQADTIESMRKLLDAR